MHVHCELPTEFGVHKVGDRRLGKREIIERARAKLRAMGQTEAAAAQEDVGALKLNVTTPEDALRLGQGAATPARARSATAARSGGGDGMLGALGHRWRTRPRAGSTAGRA